MAALRNRSKEFSNLEELKSNPEQHSSCTTIATMVSSQQQLPHELILEILSRVPSKSLARFRCVCKPWSNLTHDSIFIKLRILRTIYKKGDVVNLLFSRNQSFLKAHKLVGLDTGRGFRSFYRSHIYYVEGNYYNLGFRLKSPLGIMDFIHGSHVVGSCNGIVCLVSLSVVCLWNPCTAEYKIVRFESNINFEDPILGFGYDASNYDYKLVKFCSSSASNVSLKMYSLMDITCSTISNVPYNVPKLKDPGIFCNGGLHWLANAKDSWYKSVICFDIEQKILREVPFPDFVHRGSFISLGVLGGQLCMLCMRYNTVNEIWVMKDYGRKDSWTKLFGIGDTVIRSTKTIYCKEKYPRPLCYANNGKILLKDGNDIVLYDPKKKSATNLKIHGITDSFRTYSVMTHYPSLVSLQSGTYVETVLGVEGEEKAYLEGQELNDIIARYVKASC